MRTHPDLTRWACLAALCGLPTWAMAQTSYQYVALVPTTSSSPGLARVEADRGLHVNRSGQVAGLAFVKSGVYFNWRGLRYDATYNALPTVWSPTGQPTSLALGTDKKTSTYWVHGINNAGLVVGASPNPNTVPTLWQASGKRTVLDPRTGQARAINDSGVVVGSVVSSGTVELSALQRATLWRNGMATDLHAQMNLGAAQSSVAQSINASGAIAVQVDAGAQCQVLSQGVSQTLAMPPGYRCRVVRLADDGRAYGDVTDAQGYQHPTVWTQGQPQTLPTEPPPPEVPGPLALMKAANASGVAVGFDQSGPVVWRNGGQTPFTSPVIGLPQNIGLPIGTIVAISDDGKLVVGLGPRGLVGWGLLLPRP